MMVKSRFLSVFTGTSTYVELPDIAIFQMVLKYRSLEPSQVLQLVRLRPQHQ